MHGKLSVFTSDACPCAECEPHQPPFPELGRIFELVPVELPCCERQARVPPPPNIGRRQYGMGVATCLACGTESLYQVSPEWGPDEEIHISIDPVSDYQGEHLAEMLALVTIRATVETVEPGRRGEPLSAIMRVPLVHGDATGMDGSDSNA